MAQQNTTKSNNGPPPINTAREAAKPAVAKPAVTKPTPGKAAAAKPSPVKITTTENKQNKNQQSTAPKPAPVTPPESRAFVARPVHTAGPSTTSKSNLATAQAAPPPLPTPKPMLPEQSPQGVNGNQTAQNQKAVAGQNSLKNPVGDSLEFDPPLPDDAARKSAKSPLPFENPHVATGAMGQAGPAAAPSVGLPGSSSAADSQRRAAQRRPAATPNTTMAANDDAPTIGGLIYAMEQKPSQRPFIGASIATGIWIVLGSLFGWAMLAPLSNKANSLLDLLASPAALTVSATLLIPIATFWAVAMLIWRAQEMKLMSTAMTEVAVRLAEPDRAAEQSVASLGQSVRRQVSFMNDAVERALGRAGELEALVHAEVASLEQSYSINETRIRSLIDELSGERHALSNSSVQIVDTLRELGSEVPHLIDKLNNQQIKLASIIEGAGQNLTALETAMDASTGRLETQLGARTEALQNVIANYTGALDSVMSKRSEQMALAFSQYVENLDKSISTRTDTLQNVFEEYTLALDNTLENKNKLIDSTVAKRAQLIDGTLTKHAEDIESTLSSGTQNIDGTLSNHVNSLGTQMQQRTNALNEAVEQRLALFDETVQRSAAAFDGAVGEKAQIITTAIENQARNLSDTLGRQAAQIDETLMHGINSVRRTSESITKQSLKAIEGLANQSDVLKNVSEGILQQIGNATNRIEDQGNSILKAANQLDRANSKIDLTLEQSNKKLAKTLTGVAGQTKELDTVLQKYSEGIEVSFSEAEKRTRTLAEDLAATAQEKSQATLADVERLKIAAGKNTERALEDMRTKASDLSQEVSQNMTELTSQFSETSEDLKQRTARAASELEKEQKRLQAQMDAIPTMTRERAKVASDALQDQLRALEQLSSLSSRQVAQSAISAPQVAPSPDVNTQQEFSGNSLIHQAPATGGEPKQQQGNGSQKLLQQDLPAPTSGSEMPSNATAVAKPTARQSRLNTEVGGAQQTYQQASQPSDSTNGLADGTATRASGLANHLQATAQPSSRQRTAGSPAVSNTTAAQASPEPAAATMQPAKPAAANTRHHHSDQATSHRANTSLTASISERTNHIAKSFETAEQAAETHRTLESISTALKNSRNDLPDRTTPLQAAATSGLNAAPTPRSSVEGKRHQPQANRENHSAPQASQPLKQANGWSVGDLLARASQSNSENEKIPTHKAPAPHLTATQAKTIDDNTIDIHSMAEAMSQATATEIWQRLRNGQDGVMQRSTYSPEGRATYDETVARYRNNRSVRATIDRYLSDFEEAMQGAEQAQQDQATIQHTLTSEAGRVYLFLAHVSGRLA